MKILLVDDHVIVRSGLRNLLTSMMAVRISEAATGRDALSRLRQDRPDIVLLDLNLPGIGGLEAVAQDAAGRQGFCGIVVLSMHAEPLYVVRAMELGARGYLSKNTGSRGASYRFAPRSRRWSLHRERDRAGAGASRPSHRKTGCVNSRSATWKSCACLRRAWALPKSRTRSASATKRLLTPAVLSRPNLV